MKIARLDLRAFGPFTDLTLDLDDGDEGLHLVYGPNEAGKSSTLRALTSLLFGIPPRCADNFVHPYGELRIGAALRRAGGELFECVRRKAAKNDLRDENDDAALDPAGLAACLGGLDRETFETMFGIDHAKLVQGGAQIVKGGGNLGQTLFAAAAGLPELRAVQKSLEDQVAELFVPRGSLPKINKSLSEFDKARKAVREAQLAASQWEEHEGKLREASLRLGEVEAALQASRHARNQAERIREALPLAAKRRRGKAALESLGPVRLLSDDFAQKRRDAVAASSAASARALEAEREIRALEAKMGQLRAPEVLLARGEEIDQHHAALGSYRTGERDLPGLAASRERLLCEARTALAQLRPDMTLDDVARLRLTKRQHVELQNLGQRQGVLLAKVEDALGEARRHADELSDAQRRLAGLAPPREPGPLKRAVKRAQPSRNLEDERAATRAELARLAAQSTASVAALTLFDGDIESLEKLPLPALETVDRFDAQLEDAARRLQRLAEQMADHEARQADDERQIETLRREGDVPTEDDLALARRRRDEGWRLVRDQWRGGRGESRAGGSGTRESSDLLPEHSETAERGRAAADEDEFVEQFAAGHDLAAAYEAAVRSADALADRLRREAGRVAALARLEADRAACRAGWEKLSAARRLAAEAEAQTLADWAAAWRPAGIEPLAPREMRQWALKHEAIVKQTDNIRRQQALLAGQDERIAASRRELGETLAAAGERAAAEHESLPSLIDRAEQAAERIESAASVRSTLEARIEALAGGLSAVRQRADDAQRELDEWAHRWRSAVEILGLPRDATSDQANEVLADLEQLFVKLAQAESFGERIAGIGLRSRQFEEQVRTLSDAAALDMKELSIEEAAETLIAAYAKAVADKARLDEFQLHREKQTAALEEARGRIVDSQAILAALCQEAACEHAESLPDLEAASAAAKTLRQELADVDEHLARLAAGAALGEFLASIELADADELPTRIARLAEEAEALEAQRTDLNRTIGSEIKTLADMGAGAGAAEAAVRAQSLLAQIATDAEEYLRLRLASAVLRTAIERYRKKNQGPVLERAGALFAELTAGAFAALRADYDDAGEAVLVGLRSDGRTVGVEAMSDGTADQLYLALRLASLENYFNEKEPVPFVIDDILIKFDNERSVATLKVLAELSRRTQVIFFTHHEHLVELAERHLDAGVLFVHRLERDGAEVAATRRRGELRGPLAPMK